MGKGLGYEGRLSYSNRCNARRKRDKKPCGAWAMKGQTVCKVHGGMSPQNLRKAAERRAAAHDMVVNAVHDAMERHGAFAMPGLGLPAPWGERLKTALGIVDGHYAREPKPKRARQEQNADPPPAHPTLAEPAPVIDAEPDPTGGGPENGPSSPGDAMRRPDRTDDPDRDMPPRSGPRSREPGTGLMTLEDAVEANRAAAWTLRVHRIRRTR